MEAIAASTVGADEMVVLRRLALDGALSGEVKVSCSGLAERLDASNQTASRRLRDLESAGLVERETVSDGQWIAVTEDGRRALRTEYELYRDLFEGETIVRLRGTVTGGMGEGRHYITLSGYMEQFVEKLGYEPYAGTLNVDLDGESVRRRAATDRVEPIEIEGWADDDRTYGPAVCRPATVETPDGERYGTAHTIAPERTHHDDDQLEVIAPVKLRDALELGDDTEVIVNVGDD